MNSRTLHLLREVKTGRTAPFKSGDKPDKHAAETGRQGDFRKDGRPECRQKPSNMISISAALPNDPLINKPFYTYYGKS